MNKRRTVFSQLMDCFSKHEFNQCVKRYSEEITPRSFSFFDQYLAMSYAQVTFKESLRDIEICLASLGKKTYHMGFRARVTRSTLAYANNTRNWRIWHDLAQTLITRARNGIIYSNLPRSRELARSGPTKFFELYEKRYGVRETSQPLKVIAYEAFRLIVAAYEAGLPLDRYIEKGSKISGGALPDYSFDPDGALQGVPIRVLQYRDGKVTILSETR